MASPVNLTTLDLDTLRTLVTANDLRGYGQAAERLGRTPSAISLQMKRLQSDVGVTLFRRHGRGLALTEAGEVVLRYARRMLELNDELLDDVRAAACAGSVALGCSQDFAETLLPEVLAEFATLYPRVSMELRIEGNAALVDAIERGTAVRAVTPRPPRLAAQSPPRLGLVAARRPRLERMQTYLLALALSAGLTAGANAEPPRVPQAH